MSSYFKTSYKTLRAIALGGRYEDVAGFLVLARHASGLATDTFGPYTLSGAGVNSVHEKAAISEETARGVIERLKEAGHIKPFATMPRTKPQYRHARWEIIQGELDLDLPHAFVDALKGSAAAPPLRRIKETAICGPSYEHALKNVSLSEVRLDALMLLLALYWNTRMEKFGGVDPHCIFRKWEVKSQTTKSGGVRWGAEPDEQSSASSYEQVIVDWMQHVGKPTAKVKPSELQKTRFWNAWHNIKDQGLVYEAVALFDVLPEINKQAQLMLTVRVNDYHAGSIAKVGDASLLRELETHFGSQFAYYTPPDNERSETEAMWFIWPDKRGGLVGVWRVRYRASNNDVGAWFQKENEAIAKAVTQIAALEAQETKVQ